MDGLYEIPTRIELQEEKVLPFAWKGRKIPAALIRQVLAWMVTHKDGECQGKLFFHLGTQDWEFDVLPQFEPRGMTTKECHEDTRTDTILGSWFSRGYVLMGTIHHHCSVSAFQSGIDEEDERASNGLHITFGYMGGAHADYHSRYVHNQITFDDLPPEEFIEGMTFSLTDLGDYPKEWDERFVARIVNRAKWDQARKTNASKNTNTDTDTDVSEDDLDWLMMYYINREYMNFCEFAENFERTLEEMEGDLETLVTSIREKNHYFFPEDCLPPVYQDDVEVIEGLLMRVQSGRLFHSKYRYLSLMPNPPKGVDMWERNELDENLIEPILQFCHSIQNH